MIEQKLVEVREHRVHERLHAIPMRRRDRYWITQPERVEFAARQFRVEPFGLVDGQPRFTRVPAGDICDVFVGRREPGATVDEHDRRIRFAKGPHGLLNHAFVYARLAAGETARVDDDIR